MLWMIIDRHINNILPIVNNTRALLLRRIMLGRIGGLNTAFEIMDKSGPEIMMDSGCCARPIVHNMLYNGSFVTSRIRLFRIIRLGRIVWWSTPRISIHILRSRRDRRMRGIIASYIFRASKGGSSRTTSSSSASPCQNRC